MLDYPIRHTLVRHEQGATHMADGYARASGRVGVAIATSGPGATNMVTGIATAMLDSSPIVCITGQVGSRLIGTDAFQEIDITGITLPVTKHNYLVTRAQDVAAAVREAFQIAQEGRPGPVLIDITKDAQQSSCEFDWDAAAPVRRARRETPAPVQADLARAAALIQGAKRPVILAGHGVTISGAENALRAFAERGNIPVAATLLGIGGLPASHPLNLGMMGMHGEAWVNIAIQQADLLIACGMRFDDRVTGKLSHLRAEREEDPHRDRPVRDQQERPGRRGARRRPPRGPRSAGAARRGRRSSPRGWPRSRRRAETRRSATSSRCPTTVTCMRRTSSTISGARHATATRSSSPTSASTRCGRRSTTTTSVRARSSRPAASARWGSPCRPRSARSAPGPTPEVWAVVGDGGFQMTMCELATAVQEGIAIKVAIINNGYLGMVRQWQEFFYERRYAATPLSGPDFVKLADAFGIRSRAVLTRKDVLPAIDDARAHQGPVVIDFRVEQEDTVYPMVPAGADLHAMIRRPNPIVETAAD